MSAATPPTSSDPAEKKAAPAKKKRHDPEDFRMSIGDHLEELRNRLFLGAVGFVVACIICFVFGEHVTRWFIRPFIIACDRNDINPMMYTREVAESFMTYIKIVMISAATIAGPWLLYQVWQFIAAGLYPKERKYITKYLPLSITLLISGMVFLYFYVLPLMLEFFLAFNLGLPITRPYPYQPTADATTRPAVHLQVFKEDPANPEPGSMWINADTGLVKISPGKGKVRVLPYGPDALVSPQITMADYIDMVVGLLLSFGLSFQMPLVVLALHKIGIMDIPTLKKWRRVVYFVMSIIAACIVPDVATGMIALLIPLILLYELGILLAQWSDRKSKEQEAV
jgi:Sec-independent protein secretion pathway component TatC